MGKGKKKDKTKKEEPASLASLQLSEAPAPVAPAEEEGGLGLTGPRHRKKTTKGPTEPQATSSSSVVKEPSSKEIVTPAVTPAGVPSAQPSDDQRKDPKEEEEDEDGGLGLGGGKKYRRKKKKPDTASAQSVPTQSAPALTEPVSKQQPQHPAEPKSEQGTKPVHSPMVWSERSAPPPQSQIHQPSVAQIQPTPTPPIATYQPRAPSHRITQASSTSPHASMAWSARSAPPPQSQIHQPSVAQIQPTPTPLIATYQPPAPSHRITQASSSTSPVEPAPRTEVMQKQISPTPGNLFKIPDKILGRGVPCRRITVIANYLKMEIKPIKIHRYDIIFKPDRPKKFIPIAYKEVIKKHFDRIPIGFDQRKNLYSLNPLPGVPKEDRQKFNIVIKDTNGKDFPMEVSFKFTGIVDLNTILMHMKSGGSSQNPPTEAIQAVDVILRQGTLDSYVKAGRQFFKRPSKPIDLGDGCEMWTGLFQSAIFTSRPFVNIDVAHKAFPRSQLLIDAFINDFRLDPSRPIEQQRGRSLEAFEHFLKGLKVMAFIGGDISKGPQREFICNGLIDPPNKLSFKMTQANGKEIMSTVASYFEKEKKCRIRFPNLNCVWVGVKDKSIYYPMEFLMISYGQVCNKQMTENQLSTLVRESATPPADRKRKIEEVIKDMNYSNNQYFKSFGLDIGNQFITVDAKVLLPPKLEVGGTAVEPRRGVWQARRLLKPQTMNSWGFIAVDTDSRNRFDNIIPMIMNVGKDMGMSITDPMFTQFNVRIHDMMRTLHTARDKGVTFVFVILSARGRDHYHKLKRAAEREVGVLTQCIKEFTALRKMNDATIRNIMLKVNSKLMGINHALDSRSIPACLQTGKTMVVGADVTHPSPDQTSVPSIAAVTASLDPKFSIYNITLSIQTPKKEMIVEFEDMMVEHFNEFEKRNGGLPSKVFVFRDGVSEGQFSQVMNSELKAVHNAYRRKTGPNGKLPEVLFLLVQKRHHTRLFVPDSTYNVEPGTVVDTQIVHPRELDFYLVSHHAIKGTARPTRYHAVCNDGQISQEEVEQLTYYLCHLYSRCTRAVSYPTPTYYAHLACMRARSLTFGDQFSNSELEKKPQRLRVLERMLQYSKMFFV